MAASVTITLTTPTDLFSPDNTEFLHHLNNVINDAFDGQGEGLPGAVATKLLFNTPRISSHDQLVHELGQAGMLAIATAEDVEELSHGRYGKIVAVACIKPWKGRVVELFKRQSVVSNGGEVVADDFAGSVSGSKEYWDWEVSTCASVDNLRYRRQGLVTQCVDALVQQLAMIHNDNQLGGNHDKSLPVKLWISTRDGVGAVEYWTRRGFVPDGEPDIAPAGVWNSKGEFKIHTMSKIIT